MTMTMTIAQQLEAALAPNRGRPVIMPVARILEEGLRLGVVTEAEFNEAADLTVRPSSDRLLQARDFHREIPEWPGDDAEPKDFCACFGTSWRPGASPGWSGRGEDRENAILRIFERLRVSVRRTHPHPGSP